MHPLSTFLYVKVLETAVYTVLKSEMTQAFKNFFYSFCATPCNYFSFFV